MSCFDRILRLRVLDCYTDPLGWKDQLAESGSISNSSPSVSVSSTLCKDVKNLDKLFSSILEIGKGIVIALLSYMVINRVLYNYCYVVRFMWAYGCKNGWTEC